MATEPQSFSDVKLMKEFDPSKIVDEFSNALKQYKLSAVDLDSLVAGQKKNMEALTNANRVLFEGLQAVAKRQAEILQETMNEAFKAVDQLSKTGPEIAAKQAELTKNAFELALANMRELAEMVNKANQEATNTINARISASLDEIKEFALKLKQPADRGRLLEGNDTQPEYTPSEPPPPDQTRIIDVNLVAESFVPGGIAVLTVTIRLPLSHARGKWQARADIDPGKGPIKVLVEAQGFEIISEPPPPVDVPEDRDTAPVVFELRIVEAIERWLHVLITQSGSQVGELVINDFSALSAGPVQHSAKARARALSEADLTLVVRAGGLIEAYSPSDRASLSGVPFPGFRYPEQRFREIIRGRLKALYNKDADVEETEREMKIYGTELADSLPKDLIKLLRRPDVKSVMLKHSDDFDFPFELCYLDDAYDPFFVGDRIAICRWYMGITSPADIVEKRVGKVAFLKGKDNASILDANILAEFFKGCVRIFDGRSAIINHLFKTANFDLIHFTGHCKVNEEGMGGLELADGSFIRLIDIGSLETEQAFTVAKPFVMLNACGSAQPYVALTARDSFPYRFVTRRACAFVGTLWPISGPVANEFTRLFYRGLTRKPIGRALLAAKAALVTQGTRRPYDQVSPERKLALRVSARSYCLFANPDLRLNYSDA